MYTGSQDLIIHRLLKQLVFEIVTAFLVVVCCESVLRVAMFATEAIPAVRNPYLYGSWQDEDLFWELHAVWNKQPQAQTLNRSELGWETPPEILHSVSSNSHSSDTLLVFGDSFFARLNRHKTIADELSQKADFPYGTIINCAVPGYGLDQIVLNMEAKARQYPTAHILLGMLNSDLDRSCLSFREYSKPFFYQNENHQWVKYDAENYQPTQWDMFLSVKYCYLFDLLYTAIFYDPQQGCEDIAYKQELNAMLLERAESFFRQNHRTYQFVVFYAKDDMISRSKNWSYSFLHRFAQKEKQDCIQLDESVLSRSPQTLSGFYSTDGHFNEKGVAQAAAYIDYRLTHAQPSGLHF